MKLRLKYFPQSENYDCGPAVLRMIFEHLGRDYSEEKLIKLCNAIPKKGTTHEDLIKEVENEGFRHREMENAHIKNILTFLNNGYPVIVNYINPLSSRGHYSIVIGYDLKEKILIFADPSNGADFTMHEDEFLKMWHSGTENTKRWLLIIGREKIVID